MNQKNKNSYSKTRRDFLKNTSLISLMGMAIPELVLTWGCTGYIEEFPYSSAISLNLSLFRSEDFLYLHYSFINARKVGNTIRKQKSNRPLFLRIQLPSQHIAEQLVLNPSNINSRKSSFLSGNSFLAFKAKESKTGTVNIPIDMKKLLDWDKYFSLITIDDFFRSVEEEGKTEKRRINNVLVKFKGKNFFNDLSHDNANDDIAWPITTFEIPYKMILSPLAPGFKNVGHTYREFGKHTFLDNIQSILLEKKYDRGIRKIIKPWENELFYQSLDGRLSSPRFKVIGFNCGAEQLELLPYPDHRRQLHELTMLPPPDRDVISEYFKISSLGGSTKLRYKNDSIPDKINATIVEWNQTIKYARDNYVSITFRAIDVFTGIKLLVSIVAERKFTSGKSYLLRRYYISYMEKEKTYELPMHIGRMVFKKIIPKTEGNYFTPKQSKTKVNWYYVQKEDFDYSNGCSFSGEHKEENDLEFEYIGVDKKNRLHRFKSKIVFIPAESYEIVAGSGTYVSKVNGVECSYSSALENIPVSILHIGGLDPRNYVRTDCNETEIEALTLEDCNYNTEERQVYEYTLCKIFKDENQIRTILNQIAQDIDANSLIDHFGIKINNEFTYANIENIRFKTSKDVEVINEEIALQEYKSSQNYTVLPESENSTFFTDSIFFFSTYCNSFDSDSPLAPFLHSAKLKISQIDQIEGQSRFREVTLADDFFNLNLDRMDDFPSFNVNVNENEKNTGEESEFVDTRNPARLLFKLIDVDKKLFNYSANEVNTPNLIHLKPLSGFFGENYRRVGAMSNLGIPIAHISVLEKGIVYTPTHNRLLSKVVEDLKINNSKKSADLSVKISADSLFPGVDAEILGIPLLKIIEGSLPIDEIPEFNFRKEIRDTVLKIENSISELKQEFNDWKSAYENLKTNLNQLQILLREAQLELKELEAKFEGDIRSFLTFLQNIAEQLIHIENLDLKLSQDFQKNLSQYFFGDSNSDLANGTQPQESVKTNLLGIYNSIINIIKINNTQFEIHLKEKVTLVYQLIYHVAQGLTLNDTIEQSQLSFNELIKTVIAVNSLNENHFKELVKIGLLKLILLRNKKLEQSGLSLSSNSIQVIGSIRRIGEQESDEIRKYYKSIESAIEEALVFSGQYLASKKRELSDLVRSKIDFYSKELFTALKQNFAEFRDYENLQELVNDKLNTIYPILAQYEQIRSIYDDLKEGHYINMIEELKSIANDNDLRYSFNSIPFEELLICLSSSRLDELSLDITEITQFVEEVKTKIYKVNDANKCDILNELDRPLKYYENFVVEYQKLIDRYLDSLTIERIFSEKIEDLKKVIKSYEDQIRLVEHKLKFYSKGFLGQIEAILEDQLEVLKTKVETDSEYIAAKKKIEEIYRIKERLNEASKQGLHHQFKTNKFRSADLAGGIKFKASRNTSFTVDVNYEIEFDVTQIDRAPVISKQTYKTESAFRDFKIGFLNLISIDFEKVSFVNGSEVKDDFQVRIRDVEFDGLMRFVDGFKSYLKNLDKNIIFDITNDYASIGYNFPVGDIPLGAFNIFNLHLAAYLTLPFDPEKSLQLKFGFGSPYSKFAMTYIVIFGGQGYFLIIAEPKRGIVGLEVVLEFGAIYYLTLPGVNGEAYLVGGIYIKNYDGIFDIRGYLLCVGRLNIISLFSASVTFYLGLQSYNGGLKGACVIRVKKRFSKWFKIVVTLKMEKTIKNPNSSEPINLYLLGKNAEILIIDTNISEAEYTDKNDLISTYLTIKTPKKGSFDLQLVIEDSFYSIKGSRHKTKVSRDSVVSFDFQSLESELKNLGNHDIELRLLHSKDDGLETDIYEFNRKLRRCEENYGILSPPKRGFDTSDKDNDYNYFSAYYE